MRNIDKRKWESYRMMEFIKYTKKDFRNPKDKYRTRYSLFLCHVCGKKVEKSHHAGLVAKSCGCKRNVVRHGLSYTKLYGIWCNLKHRESKTAKICKEWSTFPPFYEWAITKGHKDNLEIEKINFEGIYEPSNCRFIPESDYNKKYKRYKRRSKWAMY